MDKQDELAFVDGWYNFMLISAIVFVVIALVVFLFYHLKVSLLKTYKEKHDYVNSSEIKWLNWVFVFLGISVACVINMYGKDEIGGPGTAFFVRLFFSVAGATLVIYIASLILRYYYPTPLNRKLRKLRYAPRTSSAGNKMKLLSEDEEDVHLNEGMQAEEDIFSIDYDVWIDEKTQEVRIEKYQGHLISLHCNNCGFYTMRVQREEIIERLEDGSPKELLKHYQCSYCKNIRATQFSISRKESEDYKHVKPKFRNSSKNIELIKIDIHSALGGKKTFEFQSVEEVQKFLNEFDFNKVV